MAKKNIVDSAFNIFADKGYDGASMEDIARAVGIKKASLYAHFKGKEEIFREIFRIVLSDYSSYLDSILADIGEKKLEAKLFFIFKKYVEYFKDEVKMNFWFKLTVSPPAIMKKEIFQKMFDADMAFGKKLYKIFREALARKEVKKINIWDMTMSFYYLLAGFAMSVSFYGGQNQDKSIKGILEVFWNGIKQE